jgi:tetratricopeptide (TPR) repeat protein
VDDAGASYRYRLLEPVRQYAATRLRAGGEAPALVARHAEWFACVTDGAGGRVTDTDPRWIDRLERDHDNLRAALSWLIEHRPARALEMAAGMAGLWLLRAHLREGSRWLERVLEAAPEPSLARAEALHARQALERRRPDNYDLADRHSQDRIAIHREHDDRRGECLALLDLADGRLLRGRFDATLALAEEAAALAGPLDDLGLRAAIHERVGLAAAWRHEFDDARAAFDVALRLCETADMEAAPASAVVSLSGFLASSATADDYPVMRLEETTLHFRRLAPDAARASLLSHRSYLHRCTGQYAAARDELDGALELASARGNELDVARLVAQRGALEAAAGDLDAAETCLNDSLELRLRLREHRGILLTLATLAVVAAMQDDPERARELLARAGRMADEAVDGPGMGGVLLAQAEAARVGGHPQEAREALDGALTVFYGGTGLLHYASWVHLQHAHLSLEVGDVEETSRRLDLAHGGFTDSGTRLGLDHCAALAERLHAANGMLTGARWSSPGQQRTKEKQ